MGDGVLAPAVAGFVQGVQGEPVPAAPAQVQQPAGSTPPAAPQAAPAPAAPPVESLMTPGGVQQIPEHLLAQRLAKAGEKAKAELLEQLGVKSADEARALLQKQADAAKREEQARLAALTETQRLDEERRKAREEAESEHKLRVEREAELEKLRREAAARRFESELNDAALAAGVKPGKLKYARFAFQEAVSGKDRDEYPDALTWFQVKLRQQEPDVFADAPAPAQQQPALQTGTTAAAPAAPTVAKTEPPAPDALKMSVEEWAKYKADLGI